MYNNHAKLCHSNKLFVSITGMSGSLPSYIQQLYSNQALQERGLIVYG